MFPCSGIIFCNWPHGGEKVPAEYHAHAPGELDGGIDWFGGPEPPIELNLCTPCKNRFLDIKKGESVIVTPIQYAPIRQERG